MLKIETGVYQHYAGRFYMVLGVAEHTESHDNLVIYIPLYCHPSGGRPLRARPESMFCESVKWPDGAMRPRFMFYGTHSPKGGKD